MKQKYLALAKALAIWLPTLSLFGTGVALLVTSTIPAAAAISMIAVGSLVPGFLLFYLIFFGAYLIYEMVQNRITDSKKYKEQSTRINSPSTQNTNNIKGEFKPADPFFYTPPLEKYTLLPAINSASTDSSKSSVNSLKLDGN